MGSARLCLLPWGHLTFSLKYSVEGASSKPSLLATSKPKTCLSFLTTQSKHPGYISSLALMDMIGMVASMMQSPSKTIRWRRKSQMHEEEEGRL